MTKQKPLPQKVINPQLGLIGLVFILGTALLAIKMFSPAAKTMPPTSNQNAQSINRNNCLADDCLVVSDLEYPVGKLSPEVKKALDEAINDEYMALETYQKVMVKLGSVRPFSMIKGAEEQHIAMLKAIYDKYGEKLPVNTWASKVSAPATLREACQVGVDVEIANAVLYRDKLLPAVTAHADITTVFTNLMNASQQKHLAAFNRCK